jgi:CRP-like cAMP-binding protein
MKGALTKKGGAMPTSTQGRTYTEILETIPAFERCTADVLEAFVAQCAVKAVCTAGRTVTPQTHLDQNLYVLISGSALLDAGDGVVVELESGDFFGASPTNHHELIASVIAVTDVELLIINAQEIERLEQVSSRDRHPSGIAWQLEAPATVRHFTRRLHRHPALSY